MMIPVARQWVRIDGRAETFFVLAVDHDREVALVVESRGHGYVEQVRFRALMPAEAKLPELARNETTEPN